MWFNPLLQGCWLRCNSQSVGLSRRLAWGRRADADPGDFVCEAPRGQQAADIHNTEVKKYLPHWHSHAVDTPSNTAKMDPTGMDMNMPVNVPVDDPNADTEW
jgi:hypothetical protein